MTLAGLTPDPWQAEALACHDRRVALLCTRQAGKTETAIAKVVATAVVKAPALILVTAQAERLAAEFVGRVAASYAAAKAGRRLAPPAAGVLTLDGKAAAEAGRDDVWRTLPEKARESALQLHLDNGSRVIGLPPNERTVRGFSKVDLLVIDEAARVPDDFFHAVTPMLAICNGTLWAMTTPFGKRGWFYGEWEARRPAQRWRRFTVAAEQCPRFTPAFLAGELAIKGERVYRQEYLCSFEDAVGQVFPQSVIDAAFDLAG